MSHKGLLIVISGPSGTGKGTVLKRLQAISDKIRFCTSVTTRAPRNEEIDGRDYRFVDVGKFRTMVSEGQFYEWVEYIGNLYGTPVKPVEELLAQGYDVLLDKEVEGAVAIKARYPESILVFILPPSFKELYKRIRERGTEDDALIKKRLDRARFEVTCIDKYDYAVINDNIDDTVEGIHTIIEAEKLRVGRCPRLAEISGDILIGGAK